MKASRFSDEFRKRIKGDLCLYCGDIATCEDHFPPAVFSSWGLLLPSCSECNSLAGDSWASDFIERISLIKTKLRNRYGKIFSYDPWDIEELEDIGSNLKGYITSWEKGREFVKKRLAWNVENYLVSIDHNNYFAQMLAEQNITMRFGSENFESIDVLRALSSKKHDKACEYCGAMMISVRATQKFCNKHRHVNSRKLLGSEAEEAQQSSLRVLTF